MSPRRASVSKHLPTYTCLRYDSTVDALTMPGIFVTYHDSQAYPEYLVTFRQA